MLGSVRAEALSYSAVKLFSKNSNLYNYVITVPKRYRQMDGQYDRNTKINGNTRPIGVYIYKPNYRNAVTQRVAVGLMEMGLECMRRYRQ